MSSQSGQQTGAWADDSDRIRIFLDSTPKRSDVRTRIFTPGSLIGGKVVLTLSDDETIEGVVIEFKGICRTKNGRNHDARCHDIVLFRLCKSLFLGPFKMRKDKYEYQFQFRFPETWNHKVCEFRDGGRMWKDIGGNGDGTGKMPLPPSIKDDGYNGSCAVFYQLSARVPRTFYDWEDKIDLNFSPYRMELEPDHRLKTSDVCDPNHQNFRLTDEGIPRPLSKSELLKHGFHRSSDTHTINFTLSATGPTNIVLGKPYPVVITLVSKDEGLEGIEPQFWLKDYHLRLKSKTYYRVPGLLEDHISFCDGHVPLSSGVLNGTLLVNTPKRLVGLFPKKDGLAPPGFTSLSIKRMYGLELKVKVVCLGEETTIKIHWPSVEVFSSKMEEGVEEAMSSIEGNTNVSGDDNALPSYTEYAGTRRIVDVDEVPEPSALPRYETGERGTIGGV
jgi:hypothetical protein